MNRRVLNCARTVASACLLLGCSLGIGQGASPSDLNDVTRASSILSGRFETVFYAKAELLSNFDAYGGMEAISANTMRFPFAGLLGALKFSGAHDPDSLLKNIDSVLVGAREFRPPAGLGGFHSKDCYVLVLNSSDAKWRGLQSKGFLKDDNGEEFRRIVLSSYFGQTQLESLGGMQVWKWSAQLGEFGEEDARKPSVFYAAHVFGRYLLVANDPDDLIATAQQLSASNKSPEVAPTIPDWQILSAHKIWGYRRLPPAGTAGRSSCGLQDVTGDVKSLSFFVDFEKQESVVRILSSDESGSAAPRISPTGRAPAFKHVSAETWEARVPFSENETSDVPLLVIVSTFGFGLFV